ncbi:MAG: amidohydrolase [Anaerolineaceae bacterium]|nr:amidohydrolase [Anaerolineaceae bacterium]
METFAEKKLPIIDGHIHFGHTNYADSLINILDQANIRRFNIVCTPHLQRLSLVPDALHLKAHFPGRCYVFGGLDISALFMDREHAGVVFAAYVDSLLEMGCDGIKMIEGKPQMRKAMPVPDFDSEIYAPYWEKMESSKAPLVFHVNDPEEFWDAQKVPDWAQKMGWFYGDGSYINNEEQYRQVLAVLERHPDLNVIFAHFFFLSAQLERLDGYLDRFPNMHIDLTPGIEMYFNFARDPQKTYDFFMKYQDRIVYGTDIGAKALLATPDEGIEPGESNLRMQLIRRFLETEGEFQLQSDEGFLFGDPSFKFYGICLPDEVLNKIYSGNFEKMVANKPSGLNPEAIIGECERLTQVIGLMGAMQPGQNVDSRMAQEVKRYFEERA